MKLIFVGGGNMAGALIGGLLKQGWRADALRAVDISEDARRNLAARFGVQTAAALPERFDADEAVLLAVKPQNLQPVAAELGARLQGQLVITIAAGIRTGDLSRWLGGHKRVIRAMPNTPALVGLGVAALYAPAAVGAADRQAADAVMAAVGKSLWVEREELLDAVTAVSGSGPAYVFYFMEALLQAATELGLTPEQARMLTLETFYGAASLARESDEPPSTLRERVTSKRGTTERALLHLEAEQVRARIAAAVQQAAVRSRELGDELGRG